MWQDTSKTATVDSFIFSLQGSTRKAKSHVYIIQDTKFVITVHAHGRTSEGYWPSASMVPNVPNEEFRYRYFHITVTS